ncbi:MAG: hypothetical protein ACM31C_15430, partial [Acidobacteriota bacterium]
TSTTKKDATAASGSGSAGSDFVMDLPKSPPEDQDPVVDVGKAIADLGAIPAWQAVVDRAQYLARRGQHGVVFGTLAAMTAPGSGSGSGSETESPYLWLVDGTDGNGALAIRVRLGDKKAKPGDRVALGGAWALDDQREWYWKVDNLSPLPAAPASTSKDPPVPPGHAIASGDLRAGTRPISKADDGDLAYFQVVGAPPVADGDGWPVADELGNPVVALLDLPGERASYGAQDMRTADERWHLKRGVTYLVRIAVVHHHGSDKPATMRARTAPIKVM